MDSLRWLSIIGLFLLASARAAHAVEAPDFFPPFPPDGFPAMREIPDHGCRADRLATMQAKIDDLSKQVAHLTAKLDRPERPPAMGGGIASIMPPELLLARQKRAVAEQARQIQERTDSLKDQTEDIRDRECMMPDEDEMEGPPGGGGGDFDGPPRGGSEGPMGMQGPPRSGFGAGNEEFLIDLPDDLQIQLNRANLELKQAQTSVRSATRSWKKKCQRQMRERGQGMPSQGMGQMPQMNQMSQMPQMSQLSMMGGGMQGFGGMNTSMGMGVGMGQMALMGGGLRGGGFAGVGQMGMGNSMFMNPYSQYSQYSQYSAMPMTFGSYGSAFGGYGYRML